MRSSRCREHRPIELLIEVVLVSSGLDRSDHSVNVARSIEDFLLLLHGGEGRLSSTHLPLLCSLRAAGRGSKMIITTRLPSSGTSPSTFAVPPWAWRRLMGQLA